MEKNIEKNNEEIAIKISESPEEKKKLKTLGVSEMDIPQNKNEIKKQNENESIKDLLKELIQEQGKEQKEIIKEIIQEQGKEINKVIEIIKKLMSPTWYQKIWSITAALILVIGFILSNYLGFLGPTGKDLDDLKLSTDNLSKETICDNSIRSKINEKIKIKKIFDNIPYGDSLNSKNIESLRKSLDDNFKTGKFYIMEGPSQFGIFSINKDLYF